MPAKGNKVALETYKQKRRFSETSEPRGSVKKSSSKQLIFVVQKHHASHLHYDFRLELDGVLKSWAVPKGPSLNPEDKRLAMMVEDHPFDYRNFEGEIPEGNYGAGQVIVWDNGTYEPINSSNNPEKELKAGLAKGHIGLVLHGHKLRGAFDLVRTKTKGDNAWLLIKKDDEFASNKDVTEQEDSVLSNKSIGTPPNALAKQAPKAALPKRIKPMLATLTDQAFDDEDFIYEIKWDGYRAIGSWDGKRAELYSRNAQSFKDKYVPVFNALKNLPKPVVLDGEVVVLDKNGRSDFKALQNYQNEPTGPLVYYAFDILWYGGHDLTKLSLIKRKEILKEAIGTNNTIRFSDHIEANGKRFFEAAKQNRLEGIMAKHKNSRYQTGKRSRDWLKIKTHMRQEVVIGGFTEPKGSRKHIGALVVGYYENGKLLMAGHTGGGIPTEQLKPLREELEKLEVNSSPFSDKFRPNAPVHWVKPNLVCEVQFSEWTGDNHMRQPIFMGMRSDKNPKDIHRESAKPAAKVKQMKTKPIEESHNKTMANKVEFTHLEKIFWPELKLTKGDLVEYYKNVADYIMPYLKDRPCTLLRHPNGYKGKSFFQKDMTGDLPDYVKTKAVYSESNQKDLHYFVCDSSDALLYMVQLGCIEMNPWSSTTKHLEKPDWAVIDLDPEDVEFEKVIEVALVVHEVCDELGVPSYPKTSGKTGIHIFIPTGAKYTYEQVRKFSEILASLVLKRTGEITSMVRNPKERQHKIYLDYLQNRESQTLAAPYSVRPVKEASVSTPLKWEEVKKGLRPEQFTVKNIQDRLKKTGDLWRPVLDEGIDIPKILDKIS